MCIHVKVRQDLFLPSFTYVSCPCSLVAYFCTDARRWCSASNAHPSHWCCGGHPWCSWGCRSSHCRCCDDLKTVAFCTMPIVLQPIHGFVYGYCSTHVCFAAAAPQEGTKNGAEDVAEDAAADGAVDSPRAAAIQSVRAMCFHLCWRCVLSQMAHLFPAPDSRRRYL